MHQTMIDIPPSANTATSPMGVPLSLAAPSTDAAIDDLAGRIAGNPEALSALRRMIQEGLDNGIEGEADDAWLALLAEGIRSRAALR